MIIGGLNCSVGLAYGMTQVGYLGSQFLKFFFQAVKYSLNLIFNPNNIIYPIKLLLKALLGMDSKKKGNNEVLANAWK